MRGKNSFNEESPRDALFNQAQYSMVRMHELLLRCDRLSINPLEFNQEFNLHNYEVIINDYSSLFLNIISKLTAPEKVKIIEIRSKLKLRLSKKLIFEELIRIGEKPAVRFNKGNWEKLNDLIFEFRQKLEEGMEEHDLGNPTKKGRTGSAILEN